MEMAAIRQRLLDFEIQPSAPRLAVAAYILNTKAHPTAEEVKAQVEKQTPSVSTATIYNTLNLFVEKGLIRLVQDPKSEKNRYDCNTHPHFHFYDEDTGQMIDLDPEILKINPDFEKIKNQFEIRGMDVTLRGRMKKKS